MRGATLLLALLSLGALGALARGRAERWRDRLPPGCAVRVELQSPEGDRLACGPEIERSLAAVGAAPLELRDGDRLTVPVGGGAATRGRMAGPALRLLGLPVDVNAGSVEDLEALPGIGPTLAERIAARRPFRSVDDLLAVPGIGARRLAALGAAVTLDRAEGSR